MRRAGLRKVLMLVALGAGLMLPAPTTLAQDAQSALRIVEVELPRESGTRTFDDVIGGFESVDYRVSLRRGQVLEVTLDSNNLSGSFDVFEPDAEKPFFVAEKSGLAHRFTAAQDGVHVIHVYLLRLAARDNQTAVYRFTVALHPAAPG